MLAIPKPANTASSSYLIMLGAELRRYKLDFENLLDESQPALTQFTADLAATRRGFELNQLAWQ